MLHSPETHGNIRGYGNFRPNGQIADLICWDALLPSLDPISPVGDLGQWGGSCLGVWMFNKTASAHVQAWPVSVV